MNSNPSPTSLSRGAFLSALALGAPLLSAPALQAQSQPALKSSPSDGKPDAGNLRAFVELARSDLKTGKTLIIAENMEFTEDEAFEFWPVHREYELELGKLQDRRLELITRYAQQYRSMTDKEAGKLANDVFDLEEARTDLKRTYFKKFSKVVPALKAARFFQIENQLNMALDLQIAASLPLIK